MSAPPKLDGRGFRLAVVRCGLIPRGDLALDAGLILFAGPALDAVLRQVI
jgi:hypothetical protein